jgi:hypothetical protein
LAHRTAQRIERKRRALEAAWRRITAKQTRNPASVEPLRIACRHAANAIRQQRR